MARVALAGSADRERALGVLCWHTTQCWKYRKISSNNESGMLELEIHLQRYLQGSGLSGSNSRLFAILDHSY